MATWVEGKPAPTPKNTLSDVNDIVNETKSPWSSPLSDASNKALEPVTPVSPHIFDNEGKLNYNLGSVTKPVTGPKPRFTPKPFSLEKSSVPYTSLGTTQAPTALKPISVTSTLTPSGKLAIDTDDAKASFRDPEAKHASSGTMLSVLSSFAQKSSIESDNVRWMKAGKSQVGETLLGLHLTPKHSNVVVPSSTMTLSSEKLTEGTSKHSETKPATVVILETSVQKLKSKKSSEGLKDIGNCRDSSQDQELHGTMQPFQLSKPSRKYSPSATQGFGTPKAASLSRATSLGFLGKWDQFTEEDKYKIGKEKDRTENTSSPRVQLRKPRPLSAWLPGTTDDQKSESPSEITIKHDEKPSTLEKTWLKKPRPLSVDLTARFEVSAHKRNISPSEDGKENVPIIKAANALPSDTRHDTVVEQEEPAAVAAKCWSSASPDDNEDETNSCFSAAKNKFDKSPKMNISEKTVNALTLCEGDNKEKITSPERMILLEDDTKDTKISVVQGEEEKEEKISTTSVRSEEEKVGTDHKQLKSWTPKELDKECSDLHRTSDGENSSLGSDDRGSKGNKVSGGIIKRRISLLLDSASSSAAKTDCPQSTTETEKINIPVRLRIKSFSSENNDSKREQLRSSQRRSIQPRPLPSDITKRFETRTVDDDSHCEKQMDMVVSSSPEHSVVQNTKEQGGRESLEKENEDKMDKAKNEQLHLMDTATEFRWSRRQSVKNVSKAFDNLATDEKTHSEKISGQNSFNRKAEEMKRQINDTSVPVDVASMTRVDTESSDGQQTANASTDSDLCIKAVRVSVIENEVRRHKVREFLHSEDPSYTCFNKGKRSEQTAHSGQINYTTMKTAAEVMYSDKEASKTKPLEPEAAAIEGRRKAYFKSEEERVSRSLVNTPPSSKVTAQNVSGLLFLTSHGKIDTWQDVSEKTDNCFLLTTSEDKVTTRHTRKSHSMMDRTNRKENVSDPKRHWNPSLPAENSSTLEAPNSQIKVAEVLNTVQNQSPHIEVRTTAKVDSDKDGKKQMKMVQLNSHCNTKVLLTSKGSPRDFGLKKDNEAANQELLPSAGSIDVKDSKGSDNVDGCKEAKRLLRGDGTIEFSGKGLPKEGRDKRRKKISLEPNSTTCATDHISDCSTGTSYVKHRYTTELLSTSDCWPVDRSKEGFSEENSKSHPKFLIPEKPKTTLLSEEFLDMPWSNSEGDASKESHAVKQPKMVDSEKPRKDKGTSSRNRHSILDLDVLMADYRKEVSKRNEEPKPSFYHDKMDNHHSSTWQKDYEEQLSKKMIKSADQGLGISSSSGKSKGTSEMLNKKHLHRNSVLDLDALMAEYKKGMPEPVKVDHRTVRSKLADGISPTVKIQKSSSFAFHEAKTYQKNDQMKELHGEEYHRDTCESVSADVKRRSKDEKRKSRPSSAYKEYDELEKCDLRSNDQKSESKRINEVETLTSTPANLNKQSKHEKKKSRPSSMYTEHRELEQPELRTDGQKSGNREKGKPREDDHSELRPRHRKNRGEERKSRITFVETDSSTQVFDSHYPDGKAGILDYLLSSRRPVHGSPHLVLEKEKPVEISADNRLCAEVEHRPADHKEEPEQKSPRVINEYLKDLNQFVLEPKTSRPFESHRQRQKAVDGLLMNQEGTSNSRNHDGRKNYSTGESQSRVTETSVHTMLSMAENKMDSHCMEREQLLDLPSKIQRKIGNMIQLTSKTKKQNEKEVYSRRSAQQEKSQDHNVDRVKQCCISPSAKAKDTDALVQERDQFCNCEERDQYGTYEERESSTNEEDDPYNKQQERKQSKQENYRPVSPHKEPVSMPAASPRKEHVHSRVSVSSQSETTPSSEQPSFCQDPRSINYGLSSGELESPDDTDSLQSTDPATHVGPTPHGFTFLEPVTTLDSGAQKSRIQLGRKTLRRAPTKHKKPGSGDQPDGIDQFLQKGEDSWMYKDSTESRPPVQEELIEQDVSRTQKLTITQCPRVAMFPGMDPSVLKASLRRNRQENGDEEESSCEQQCRSCSPPAQQGLRVLPTTTSKGEGSEEMPPPWLQELKSKKRLSQHQSDRKNE
ncbi:uncharacterized protein LOC121285829 isoform X1 [Carcharodon carcharias]|uniref:uncharacterized protein LOC121285829 isoform X1 n=1 Tax=Carcharodon carcharias TaxID=13397 RepID=UPI001B7F69BD|nr:uncharacterized protein LOC121285829 isoform X1 [Carcharodon carcharias]